ncbi:MAG TPA: hypothetical protein DD417_05990 [Elusimicrobia bacterium]|nr:hypothetical protein [Elusimicrobiota bacterium]
MTALGWPLAAAMASAGLNGAIGVLASVRSGGQTLYRSLALMSFSFSLWSMAYVAVWPEFHDPFWMKVMFTPLSWLPGASLDFVWSFTGLPPEQRRLRTTPLYLAGLVAAALMWAGRISIQRFEFAYILGGLPVFAVALTLLTLHWRRAEHPAERNRRGYFLLAAWIAVIGGFADFLPAVGIPFPSVANIALIAYSLIVLMAIERHHLLDLRAAMGQALALIGASGLLGLALSLLARVTTLEGGTPFISFFVTSLALLWALPLLWKALNRTFNRPFLALQEQRERVLESAERSLEGVSDIERIEDAARTAAQSIWSAECEVLWHGPALRGFHRPDVLPEELRIPLAADPQPQTLSDLERAADPGLARLREFLEKRKMAAVAPILREGQLVGVLLLGAPERGYFELAGVRWLRRFAQALGRAVRSAELAQGLLHADRLAQMGTLAAGIAHEVRNPLSAMRGAAELLHGPLPEETRLEYLRILEDEITRMDEILTSLLDYASARTPKARCRWAEVWDRVERLIRVDLPRELKLRQEGADLELAVAGAHLQQILINLVKNAVRAALSAKGERQRSEDGAPMGAATGSVQPEVRVSLTAGDGCAVLEVSDSGSGIPAEVFDRLFIPFASASPGGTGLGLATVRRLAELYGGRAWAENGERGARFVVELPIADGGGA